MATIVPSLFIDTLYPLLSPAASPSISEPNWFQWKPLVFWNKICESLASLLFAPIPNFVPSYVNVDSPFNVLDVSEPVIIRLSALLFIVVLPPPLWSTQLKLPLPSVFNTWFASPSLFGNVRV